MAHILLVDDDPDVRYVAARVLRRGFATKSPPSTARSRRSPSSKKGGACDLIVCDRMLPAMNGLAFLSALRTREMRQPRFIFLSARAPRERDRRGARERCRCVSAQSRSSRKELLAASSRGSWGNRSERSRAGANARRGFWSLRKRPTLIAGGPEHPHAPRWRARGQRAPAVEARLERALLSLSAQREAAVQEQKRAEQSVYRLESTLRALRAASRVAENVASAFELARRCSLRSLPR